MSRFRKSALMPARSFVVLMMVLLACAAARSAPQRDLTDADERSWRLISSTLLTADGLWLVYTTVPVSGIRQKSGAVEVIVRSTQSTAERRYTAGNVGDGAGNPGLSRSGRWMAFKSVLPEAPSHASVVAVELASGRSIEFRDVQQFAFVADARDDAIVLHHKPVTAGAKLAPLELIRLADGTVQPLDSAAAFAVNEQQTRVAWSGSRGVGFWDGETRHRRVLGDGASCLHSELTWSLKGTALAALRFCDNAPAQLATFTHLADSRPVFKSQRPTGMPKDLAISADTFFTPEYERRAVLTWRNDERGVYFGVRPTGLPPDEAKAKQTPTVVLWHARDQLPALKSAEAKAQRTASFLSYMSLDDGRYVRLEDEHLHVNSLQLSGRYVLAYDADAYRRPDDPNFSRDPGYVHLRDYYLLDLRTGERRRVVEKLSVLLQRWIAPRPQLSPDGSIFLYQENGDYIAYDIATGRRRNLTASLPTKFYLEENSRNQRLLRDPDAEIVSPLQGWTANGRYVLISDYYDVWALPLREGVPENLTGNGRRETLVYEITPLDGLAARPGSDRTLSIDLRQPLFFQVTDVKTGDTGLARRPHSGATQVLTWERARALYYKAQSADLYVMARTSSVQPFDFHLLDAQFRAVSSLTDVSPEQREIRWPPAARLISYPVQGQTLRGILHLPVGYEPGRSYPTIVSIYERQSPMLHNYQMPGHPIQRWLMQGYAVLLPDIRPRVNEAGKAALEAVLAAVEAAAATGAVDRNRLGLIGHSYGGFETNYIVTRTPIFKAAVPEAGLSDLLSHYGGIYDRYGLPNSYLAERGQPYLAGPWWQNWDAFIENSPVFHAQKISTPLLIVHGDDDHLVPFSQAVEMFNTLRRMGNDQVVLLQYVGSDHEFVGDAAADLRRRTQQFFDHFLKGSEAPRWWSEGVSQVERIQ